MLTGSIVSSVCLCVICLFSGASTNVGYTGRPYSVLLAPRCWWHGMIVHELG